MNGKIRAHAAILTANILFALNYSYSKTLIPGSLTPDALCIARIGCAAVVFVLVAVTLVRERILWRDLGWLALAALFGTGGNQYLFLHGLRYTSPVDAAIISVTGPVLVLVISALLGRDRITWMKSIGIAVGASGALLTILYGGIAHFGSGHLTGNVLVFIAALSYACYLVVVKNLMMRYRAITVTAWMFGLSTLAMIPFLGHTLVATDWDGFTPAAWGSLAFVVFGATVLSYLCVAGGLKKLKPTTVSIYTYLQPVIATLAAILRGQDKADWVKIVAALLVFAGVFLVTRSYRSEDQPKIVDNVVNNRQPRRPAC
ncbi:DMT family transporter [uncultured Rikenella sp.]|uniref:DMT family transporter n=1 Tax=uncultured Rikenella sp. TaxID=368003 RepID=UPI00262AB2B4|nr:DMT family transporter [uncultured Rikenella sp.]